MTPQTFACLYHDDLGFGLEIPHLYKSAVLCEADLRRTGLWPLHSGWRIVYVDCSFREIPA